MGTEWEASGNAEAGTCLMKMADGCYCEISHEKLGTFRNNLYLCPQKEINDTCYAQNIRILRIYILFLLK